MNIQLFIPCYIDQVYPHVGMATVRLLESLGCTVTYPDGQTCCGQPLLNAGHTCELKGVAANFIDVFSGTDPIVCPSASCVSMVRNHYAQAGIDTQGLPPVFELCEFLAKELKVSSLPSTFSPSIGVHYGCHGVRELGLSEPSELLNTHTRPDIVRGLLELMSGITIVERERTDECCGFGGMFCESEADVSGAMGQHLLDDFLQAGAEVIVSADMSCLMHLDGMIQKQQLPLRVAHIAEVLAGDAS
jgi:L-lactate dehydrogenase complex protein LldE